MIRLLSISIRAFRGVRDQIDLDLSAPITLICAANGSGKTSICEAAEWLLTGTVKRLEAIDRQKDIRCEFADVSIATQVSATIDLGKDRIELERTLNVDGSESVCRWRIGGDDRYRRVTSTSLLERLAPSAVENAVNTKHANSSRQIWLRGTRFLSGDALATLLDSDEESEKGRQRLFADLLGVGHLLETERQLRAYQTEIAQAVRRQQTRLDDKNVEIKSRMEAAAVRDRNRQRNWLNEAQRHLRLAREVLQSPDAADVSRTHASTVSDVSHLESLTNEQKAILEQRQSAEAQLIADWPERDSLQTLLASARKRFDELAQEETDRLEVERSQATKIIEARQQVNQAGALIARFGSAESSVVQAHAALLNSLPSYKQKTSTTSLSRIEASRLLNGELSASGSTDTATLRSLLGDLPTAIENLGVLDARKAAYENAIADAPSEEASAATREALIEASEHLASLTTDYGRIAEPLKQLHDLASAVASGFANEDCKCPVCAHDWQSKSGLMNALASASARVPLNVERLAQEMHSAQKEVQRLQDQSQREMQLFRRETAAARVYQSAEAAVSAFATRVRQAGFSAEVVKLRPEIERELARREILPSLMAYLTRLLEAEALCGQKAVDGDAVESMWESVKPGFHRAKRLCEKEFREAEGNVAELVASQAQSQQVRQKLEEERKELEQVIRQTARRTQSLESAWRRLAGEIAWSDAALANASRKLRADVSDMLDAERAIAQAKNALRELIATQELESLKKELEPLEQELARLTTYADSAAAIRLAYSAKRQAHAKQQMEDIVRAISALFTRMQANLVYDDVASGDKDTPLSWRAYAEELSLDPEATFSQGQRQDFALSIFLARARGLGGTFFLDEPVAHLDDLNRVALLDVFRAIAIEEPGKLSFVLTTANKPLVRHFVEKFQRVSPMVRGRMKPLRLVEIEGNPRAGLRLVVQE